MKPIGHLLRELRESADKTQRQVAEDLNISNKMLSNYERDERLPPIDMIIDICQYYNVPTDYLLQTELSTETQEKDIEIYQKLSLRQRQFIRYFDALNDEHQMAIAGISVFFRECEQFAAQPVS